MLIYSFARVIIEAIPHTSPLPPMIGQSLAGSSNVNLISPASSGSANVENDRTMPPSMFLSWISPIQLHFAIVSWVSQNCLQLDKPTPTSIRRARAQKQGAPVLSPNTWYARMFVAKLLLRSVEVATCCSVSCWSAIFNNLILPSCSLFHACGLLRLLGCCLFCFGKLL